MTTSSPVPEFSLYPNHPTRCCCACWSTPLKLARMGNTFICMECVELLYRMFHTKEQEAI